MMSAEKRKEEYEKITEVISENKNKLLASLTDEQRQWYYKIFYAYIKELEIRMDENFEEGVLFGTSIVQRFLLEDD